METVKKHLDNGKLAELVEKYEHKMAAGSDDYYPP